MAGRIIWSEESKVNIRAIIRYLRKEFGDQVARRKANEYIQKIEDLYLHPTKGMLIDRERGLRRWPLDRRNYVTYLVSKETIIIHNILAYKLNRRGF